MRSASESFLRFPLSVVFGTRGVVRVLREFVLSPSALRPDSVSKRTRLSVPTIHKVIEDLEQLGLLVASGSGRNTTYKFDGTTSVAKIISDLFVSESRRLEEIRRRIAQAAEELRYSPLAVWIVGSFARGEDEPRSDLDLVLVFDTSREAIVEQMRRDFMRNVEPVALESRLRIDVAAASCDELVRLSRENSPFWLSLEQPLVVIGKSPSELIDDLEHCHYSWISPEEEARNRVEEAVAAEEDRMENARRGDVC